jgi:hypothetical protein
LYPFHSILPGASLIDSLNREKVDSIEKIFEFKESREERRTRGSPRTRRREARDVYRDCRDRFSIESGFHGFIEVVQEEVEPSWTGCGIHPLDLVIAKGTNQGAEGCLFQRGHPLQ